MGKILGLDFGLARIGYAVSDETHKIAFPRDFVAAAPQPKFIEKISNVIKEERIIMIVVGVPLGIDNEETEMSLAARKFGENLERAFSIPVEFIEETGSSDEALAKIPFRKNRREKGFKDAIAAQIILQKFLDSRAQIQSE